MHTHRTDTRARATATLVALAAGTAVGGSAIAQGPLTEPFPAQLELADMDGTIGFRLDGIGVPDWSGWSVASAGDVNNDGLADLIIGAAYAFPGGRAYAGESYVVFGRDAASGGFPAVFELADLDGMNGFRLAGVSEIDSSGWSVASAGDVNGDGVADLIIGGPVPVPPGVREDDGTSHVVFGRNLAGCAADLDGDGELTIFDFLAFQNLFDASDPRADFDGDGDFTIFDFLAFQNAFDVGCV